jgi:hypothetical protein
MLTLLAEVDTNWAAWGLAIPACTALVITVAYIVSLKGDIRVEKEKGTGRDARLKKLEEHWADLTTKLGEIGTNVAVLVDRSGGPGDSGLNKAINK